VAVSVKWGFTEQVIPGGYGSLVGWRACYSFKNPPKSGGKNVTWCEKINLG